ncbi:tumor necrosis factor receptor superfamily member 14-like [Nelusetta ayraudi]|uniref:tumor necrosis factor receptor superfamily member 14-like n=1 Tax=Nelusetta ayraudi TaxID=303726 RepID=UPI003F6FCD31
MDAVFPVGVLVMLTFCSELSVMTPSRYMIESATVSFLMVLLLNISGCFSQQCHPSEYWSGTDCCPKCPAGKHVKTDCTQHRSTSCTWCEGGTFMDQPNGLQQCFPCRSCDTDSGLTVKTACTTTSNAVCEPVEGFYCVDVSQGGCAAAKQHSSCQPGQYISKKGSLYEDTECSACPGGTFSNGTSSSCQPHTQCQALNPVLIKAGSSSADAECGPPGSDHTGVIVGVPVSLIVVASIAGGLVYYCSRQKRKTRGENKKKEMENENDQAEGVSFQSPESTNLVLKRQNRTPPTELQSSDH